MAVGYHGVIDPVDYTTSVFGPGPERIITTIYVLPLECIGTLPCEPFLLASVEW
jgi:hypothetical protein